MLMEIAGFDGHRDDPSNGLKLSDEDYFTVTKLIMRVAKKHCGGKIVSVLEGGYQLDKHVLKKCVHAHLRALLSDDDYVSPAVAPPEFTQFVEPLPPAYFTYPGMRGPHPASITINTNSTLPPTNGNLSTTITKTTRPPTITINSSPSVSSPIPKPYNPITDSSSAPHASTSISKITSSNNNNNNDVEEITVIEENGNDSVARQTPPKKGSIEALLS